MDGGVVSQSSDGLRSRLATVQTANEGNIYDGRSSFLKGPAAHRPGHPPPGSVRTGTVRVRAVGENIAAALALGGGIAPTVLAQPGHNSARPVHIPADQLVLGPP